MTVQIETSKVKQSFTRGHKLRAWLTTLDQAMAYDPQEHRDATVTHLWKKVEQLETRVNELEGRDQRAA